MVGKLAMTNDICIITTDFGEIVLGPKFSALFASHDAGLCKRKNSKAYKSAKWQRERAESAFILMHETCYRAGVEFPGVTP